MHVKTWCALRHAFRLYAIIFNHTLHACTEVDVLISAMAWSSHAAESALSCTLSLVVNNCRRSAPHEILDQGLPSIRTAWLQLIRGSLLQILPHLRHKIAWCISIWKLYISVLTPLRGAWRRSSDVYILSTRWAIFVSHMLLASCRSLSHECTGPKGTDWGAQHQIQDG